MDEDRLASRYAGKRANGYDDRRQGTRKWKREQDAISAFLAHAVELNPDPVVLDVPVGTGRFLDLYNRLGVSAVGVDASPDMLDQAREKHPSRGQGISLRQGDIMDLAALDVRPDIVVCVRFLNWLEPDSFEQAIRSIAELEPRHVLLDVRLGTSWRHSLFRRLRNAYHAVARDGDAKTTIHDETFVLETFAQQGWHVRERDLVDSWAFGDKYVFWLTSRR